VGLGRVQRDREQLADEARVVGLEVRTEVGAQAHPGAGAETGGALAGEATCTPAAAPS
jgi:hypothetical protein